MFKFSDSHHFRKTVAGACMVIAPLLLLVGVVIHPERKDDVGAQLAVISGHLDAWYIAYALILASLVLAVPAVLGLMHMLREREVVLGHLGGALGLIGVLALTGLTAIYGFVGWQAAVPGADHVQMTALFERLTHTAGVVVPFFAMSFAFMLGVAVLALGLYRARAVQSWMAALVVIGVVGLAVSAFVVTSWLAIVAAAFLLVGLGSIGRYVLRESDADWEHTPEYQGFRPLAGMR
jgi:hypothetical protein